MISGLHNYLLKGSEKKYTRVMALVEKKAYHPYGQAYGWGHSVLQTQISSLHVFISRVENIVDLDQLASQKPADLDVYRFQNRINQGSHGKG